MGTIKKAVAQANAEMGLLDGAVERSGSSFRRGTRSSSRR
jgi:fumarate hydratase class II